MDVVFSKQTEDTPVNKMNSQTIRINNEIDALHAQNVILVQKQKYSELPINLTKIKELELKKANINKVEELTELMTFLNMELHKCDLSNYDHQIHRSFNGHAEHGNNTKTIDRRLFKSMFEAITELNRKVEELTPKQIPNEPIKCKCCKGFGNDLVQDNGYCRHCAETI